MAKSMTNFITCRLMPTFDSLMALALQEAPVPKLGNVEQVPGAEKDENLGGISVNVPTDANNGTTANVIAFASDLASNNLGNESSSRRLSFLEPSDPARRLTTSTLTASCYTRVTYNSKYIGQLKGDCVAFSPSQPLASPAAVCMPIQTDIPVNPNFTVAAFGSKVGTTYSVLGGTVTVSADGLSYGGSVQASGTYCPILRHASYTAATTVSADSSCDAVAAQNAAIATQAATLISSGFTFGGFVAAGQTAATTAPTGAIGASGTVADLSSAVASAQATAVVSNTVPVTTTTATTTTVAGGTTGATVQTVSGNGTTTTTRVLPGEGMLSQAPATNIGLVVMLFLAVTLGN